MLTQVLTFLVTTLCGLFALALLLRFVLQLVRAPVRNQLSQFLSALTNFAVIPVRRLVPGWWGLDLATLLLAWVTQAVQIWLVMAIKGHQTGHAVGVALAALAALAAVQLIELAVYIVMGAIIVQVLLSWIGNPMPALNNLTQPFLRPLQRFIPPIANVDVTPFVVLLICQLVLMAPIAWMEQMLGRFL